MRRRVLFVTSSYPEPDFPQLGIFVKEHARAAARHADVAVLHLDRSEKVRGIQFDEAHDGEFPTWRVRYPHSPAPLSYLGNVLAGALGYRRVRRSGFEPDVLHAHFFLAGIPAVLIGKLARKPVVVTEQWSVFLPDDPATLSPVVRRAAKFALEGADLVLPVSEALRDGIRGAGIDARFRVVPNVYDAALFHPGEVAANGDGKRILSVGAFYEAKGWEYLFEALALLARERDDVGLEVIGDGPQRAELEALRARLGLEERIRLDGWRTKQEVADAMRSADVFTLTSRYDSNPCALIEALGSGLPVVATRVGGIPGMVPAEAGLLAEPRNPESIAAGLAAVLDEPGRFDRAAIAAAARERYSVEHVGAAFADAYEEVLRR